MNWILVLTLLSMTPSSQAEDVFDIAAKYNEKKNKVVNLETQRRKTLAEIYNIEKETNKIEIKKTELHEQKIQLDQELKDISARVVQIELELHELTPVLTQRIEFVEQVNKLPWFYTFLTAQSLSDLDQMLDAADRINSHQAEQILSFAQLIGELKIQKQELRKTAIEIVKLRKEIHNKEKNVEKNQIAKNKILKTLEKNIKSEKIRLKTLEGKGKRAVIASGLEDLALLFGTGFFNKKGELPLPVKGSLVQAYGINEGLLVDRVKLLHKGHFYRTAAEQRVVSVAPGKIKFSGPVEGFGQVVIIDHGGRYYTTYANLSSYLVSKGTEVRQKEMIGKTGSRHLQMGTGLYFEIRHFSQPQDPAQWLVKDSTQLANL